MLPYLFFLFLPSLFSFLILLFSVPYSALMQSILYYSHPVQRLSILLPGSLLLHDPDGIYCLTDVPFLFFPALLLPPVQSYSSVSYSVFSFLLLVLYFIGSDPGSFSPRKLLKCYNFFNVAFRMIFEYTINESKACRSSRLEYDERVCLTSASDGVLQSVEYRLLVRRVY